MVGDWILYDGKPVRVNCVASSSVGLEGVESDTICKDDMIEPILITAEILEKNGFIKTGDGWECDENDVVSIALHSEKSCDMWIAEASYEWKHIKYILPYPKCVHELQHALKLCGIDKEIEP
jgi:hypothetical protein